MRIAILVEGKTEMAFKPILQDFLKTRLAGKMPKLDFLPYDGRIPTGNKLKKMQNWVGQEDRFFPHVALYDFEAWLLPYWEKIKALTGSNRAAPAANPEKVDHDKPPAYRVAEVYRTGAKTRSYVKPRDAGRILKDEDLMVAIHACAELKAFINRILELCGVNDADLIP